MEPELTAFGVVCNRLQIGQPVFADGRFASQTDDHPGQLWCWVRVGGRVLGASDSCVKSAAVGAIRFSAVNVRVAL